LRVVSPLAEGADRLVAKAGLAHGAELVTPLPFPRALYMRDFETAASREEFDALLALATEVVELDGSRASDADRKAAYEKVGDRVVDESDLLIALWDGAEAAGRGGTANVVARARRNGLPVVWLPVNGGPMRLLVGDSTIETDVHAALRHVVGQTLAAPRRR
jgi:hypothetical protein